MEKLLDIFLRESSSVKKAVKEKPDMDYKKYISMQVDIKTLYSCFRIKGELVAVYSNVLIVQGITCWGILAHDILDFKVLPENNQSGLFQEKGGSTVTPPEGVMGDTTKGMAR